MSITFIVSTAGNETALLGALSAIALQTVRPYSVLVADNGPDLERSLPEWLSLPKYRRFNFVGHGWNCYPAADHLVESLADDLLAEWLGFPSDDGYLVPGFSGAMLHAGRDADLVLCDCVYDPRRTGKYEVLSTRAENCAVDKTTFIVRREWFIRVGGFCGYYGDRTLEHVDPDGRFVEAVARAGARVAKVHEVLVFHN